MQRGPNGRPTLKKKIQNRTEKETQNVSGVKGSQVAVISMRRGGQRVLGVCESVATVKLGPHQTRTCIPIEKKNTTNKRFQFKQQSQLLIKTLVCMYIFLLNINEPRLQVCVPFSNVLPLFMVKLIPDSFRSMRNRVQVCFHIEELNKRTSGCI